MVSRFEGSVAIVEARGAHQDDPEAPIKKALIPVTGNENARRGAEVAITLAHALHAQVSTLSVIGRAARNRPQLRRETQAVTDEIKKIAKYLGTKIQTAIRTEDDPGTAILRMIERDKSDLVAMGVSRRPGDRLSFGDVADTLLEGLLLLLVGGAHLFGRGEGHFALGETPMRRVTLLAQVLQAGG